MKKMLLRAFLLLLALLMVIPFAGCQETPKPQETNPVTTPSTDPDTDGAGSEPTDTEPEENGPNLPEKNYNKEEFTILMRALEEYKEDIYVASIDMNATSLDRAVYQRLQDLTYYYNLIIDPVIKERPKDEIPSAAKAGVDVYDMVVEHSGFSLACAASGYYYDWNDLPYVDLDADWWSADARNAFTTPLGKLYTMIGDISYMSVGASTCMFFNKEILSDVQGLASPYDLVRDKTWTFETFEEYVTTLDANMDGDGTGALETDSFGYGTGWWAGPSQLLHSTGYRTIEWKNEDWKFTLDNDTTSEAVFDMRDLLWNSGACYAVNTQEFDALIKPFTEGRLAFTDGRVAYAREFAGEDLSYGIVPWPKYNKKVREYYSTVNGGTNLFSVLRNTTPENAERISIVLEFMAYEGYRTVVPLYYETILSYQYLKDEDSIEMLQLIHNHRIFDLGYFYSPVSSLVHEAIMDPTGPSLSTALDKIEEAAREELFATWNLLDEQPTAQ
ncbi:MAG: hypothetical protein II369_03555 [Clostridia bacterium]|nr:hypothetical protein [Clostridia bacterium]